MLAAITLIVIGVVMLLSNLGYIKIANLAGLIHTWWPLILFALGVALLARRRK